MTDQQLQEIAGRLPPALEGLAPPDSSWFSDGLTLASFAMLTVAILFAIVSSVTLRHQRNRHANNEWWTRAQWALEASTSASDRNYAYGTAMLEVLAKSSAAGPKEKAIFDAVWRASYTRMQDALIQRFIEQRQEAVQLNTNRLPSANHAKGQTTVRPLPVGALSLLRREILAARLKIVLDEQFGRETSSAVRQLAAMQLPLSA